MIGIKIGPIITWPRSVLRLIDCHDGGTPGTKPNSANDANWFRPAMSMGGSAAGVSDGALIGMILADPD